MESLESDRYNDSEVDLTYFDKRRANMLKSLVNAIIQKERFDDGEPYESFLEDTTKESIANEFDTQFDVLLELANQDNPPNKISLILEFIKIKNVSGRVPTKEDMEKHSKFTISQYDDEFKSWEQLLDRLGYDPWYREELRPAVDPNFMIQDFDD